MDQPDILGGVDGAVKPRVTAPRGGVFAPPVLLA